jgi:hypothetical protein
VDAGAARVVRWLWLLPCTSMKASSHPTLVVALFVTWLDALSAAAQKPPHPTSVRIINARGEIQREDVFGDAVGNVEVTMSNGRRQVWTASLWCALLQNSQSGLLGWTYAAARPSRGAWMNNELCVARSKQDRTHLHASCAFTEFWAFTDRDTHVVVRSRNLHGPPWIERFHISTGQLIDSCSGNNYPEKRLSGRERIWINRSLRRNLAVSGPAAADPTLLLHIESFVSDD